MKNDMTMRERIENTLRGGCCDKIPWATRLDIWHTAATRSGTMPEQFLHMDLMDIHRHLGIGRQGYTVACLVHLHGVEVTVEFNGEVIQEDSDPLMLFPVPRERVPEEEPGNTRIWFKTPVGRSYLTFRTTETSIREAEMPYLVDHIIKDDNDFQVVKWILNHAEYVAYYKG